MVPATIPVGIEAHSLTGFRKLLVIQSGVSVAGMGDSMGEERLTVRFDQPISAFDDLNLETGFLLARRLVAISKESRSGK